MRTDQGTATTRVVEKMRGSAVKQIGARELAVGVFVQDVDDEDDLDEDEEDEGEDDDQDAGGPPPGWSD